VALSVGVHWLATLA